MQAGEDQKLASQRAMQIGNSLISLGVLPLQLRAKGYGVSVPISRTDKMRLRLKSARRVTFHCLSEICMRGTLLLGAGLRVFTEAVAARCALYICHNRRLRTPDRLRVPHRPAPSRGRGT
mgnify:CR=1 FL=1